MFVIGGLLLLTAGLLAAAGYQIVRRRLSVAAAYKGPSPLIAFAVVLVLVNTISVVLVAVGVPVGDSPRGFLVGATLLFAGYAGVVWLLGFRTSAMSRRSIGLPAGLSLSRLLADVGLGAGTMLLVALVAGLIGSLIALLLDTSTPNVVPTSTAGIDIALIVVAACIVVPIGEELFFRGYAIGAWLPDLGERSALLRATYLFAAIHILNVSVDPNAPGAALDGLKQATLEFLIIAPVGLALGWLFLRRGLIAAIAGHATFNLFGVLALLLAQTQS